MLTVGSISREEASRAFPFLAEKFSGRRNAIRDLTHAQPEVVFWISPAGEFLDAGDAHRKNPPKGFEHILDDEPDYGGFLRGRVVRSNERQLIVVYCREETLSVARKRIRQFLSGVAQMPVPIDDDALVISDNADLYGTMTDLEERAR